ncbi:S-layer homology domain-containing protein [Bacillus thuringiensis]|nr:S-layer homology domain-containing protein [Bacillus thuringiensis]MED3352952.1 S-layer homology domain-containing protein [Bacillus thuringiensis]
MLEKIYAVVSFGLMRGYENNKFGPNHFLIRKQLGTIL